MANKAAPKTVTELRAQLCETIADLQNGEVNVKLAYEMSNMAGKITSTLKMQLEYAKLRKEKPAIDFLR